MNYLKRIILGLFIAGNVVSVCHAAPEMPRKVLSVAGAPVATAGIFYLGWKGLDTLASKVSGFSDKSPLAGARYYATGLAMFALGYHLASPLQQYFYTLFSGDVERLNRSLVALDKHENEIKETLKEILFVKSELEKKSLSIGSLFGARDALEADPLWGKVAAALGGVDLTVALNLPQLTKIAPDTAVIPSHWYDLRIVKAAVSCAESVQEAVMRPIGLVGQTYHSALWNFTYDAANPLLLTWGGSSIKCSARNIREMYACSKHVVLSENAKKFQDSAHVMIEYALNVLSQVKDYKNAIKRVKDLNGFTDSAVAATSTGFAKAADFVDAIKPADDGGW